MDNSIEIELEKWLSKAKRVAVIGIGNPIRMDDSVGIKIIQDLRGKLSNGVLLVECETTPENYIQQIVDFKPTHILIIDAAILDLEPGKIVILGHNDLKDQPAFSTHILPLKIFCEYITEVTGAEIKLLLIQPKEVGFGEELTAEILSSKEKIVEFLLSILSPKTL